MLCYFWKPPARSPPLLEVLQLLPQLSDLTLAVKGLTAADIAPISGLQHLQQLNLRKAGDWARLDRMGPRLLLSALQHLTQLQRLLLDLMLPQPARHNMPQNVPHNVPQLIFGGQGRHLSYYQSFSALTASTQLTALHLEGWDKAPVPLACSTCSLQGVFCHLSRSCTLMG